ncbi:MAG: FapA family protein, partial [Spirochaetaceae bacterium]|nr:FapA family protein [Spirochaetaceae bacterium]
MVDFAVLQAAVKERLEIDSAVQIVETEGDTLEAAISEAATLLAVPLRYIEYEIIEKHTSFFGIGKNLCKIRANRRSGIARKDEFDDAETAEEDGMQEFVEDDVDGAVYVQCRQDGVYMKITPARGEGREVNRSMAVWELKNRSVTVFDSDIVNHLLHHSDWDYIRVADFQGMAANDTSVLVEIADDETSAFIRVKEPGLGGRDFTYEEYVETLNKNGVIAGIDEQFLKSFADKPVYKEKVCVASAKKAVDGENSYLEYFFETEPGRVKLSETAEGKVNFKELNIIQNVLKDETLAKLHSAGIGEAGVTVTGKPLPARDGKDIPVTLGKNVRFSEDGLTILADINGQVVMANGKINVEAVYTIDGSVDLKTGNIIFLG